MVTLVVSVAMAVVFLGSSLSKSHSAKEFRLFAESLSEYGLGTQWAKTCLAAFVVFVEILVVVIMPVPFGQLVDRLVPAIGLLAALTVATAVSAIVGRRRGGSTSCRCFGAASDPIPVWFHLSVNGGLLAVGVVAIVLGEEAPTAAGPIVFATGCGVMIGVTAVAAAYLYSALSVTYPADIRTDMLPSHGDAR